MILVNCDFSYEDYAWSAKYAPTYTHSTGSFAPSVTSYGKEEDGRKASGAGRAGDPEVDERGCGEVCPMCSAVIVEASKDVEGQDAIVL